MKDKVRDLHNELMDWYNKAIEDDAQFEKRDIAYMAYLEGRASLARQVPMVAINVILSQFKADQFNAFMRVREIDLVKSFLSTVEESRK